VGRAKAKEMNILGDPISAEEACRLGLVLRVAPHGSVLADAITFAESIASKPRFAVRFAKSFYNRELPGCTSAMARSASPHFDHVVGAGDKRRPHHS
jgi:enoyl-CoA hydratase/carnithine racemase